MEQNDIKTFCKECTFESKPGCCKLNVPERLNKNKYNHIVFNKDDDDSLIIDNHVCVFCRNQAWANYHNNVDLENKVRHEVRLKTTLILYIEDNDEETITKHIQNRWSEIAAMKDYLMPYQVIFINHTTSISISELFSICKPPASISDIKWSIENILIDVSSNCTLNIAVNAVKTTYFCFYHIKTPLKPDAIQSIDIDLNDNLEKFIAKITQDGGFFIQTKVFKTFGGNNDDCTIIDKLKEIAEEQECQYLVKICSNQQ